jgi:hypothetical protein
MSSEDLEGQAARWIQRLQEYNFTFEHRQSRKHKNANALSRRPCREECTTPCKKVQALADVKKVRAIAAVAADGWDPAVLREQLSDRDVGPILQEIDAG